MKAGIAISGDWFEGQARRVYQGFKETEQERDCREVCEWIREHGCKTTPRQLANGGPKRLRNRAHEVLADLEAAGLAKRIPQSGNRGDEYVLCDSDSCDREAQCNPRTPIAATATVATEGTVATLRQSATGNRIGRLEPCPKTLQKQSSRLAW